MTHALTITHAGGTVNLNEAGAIEIMEYAPLHGGGAATVVDAIRLRICASSAAGIGTAVAGIEKALEAAARSEKDAFKERAYLNFQPTGYASSYRAEVLGLGENHGRLELEPRFLADRVWGQYTQVGMLYLTRRNEWQGPEVQLPLSNSNGSGTDAIPIFNCNDGTGVAPAKRENWVSVAGTAIPGSLPAPVKVVFTNTYDNATRDSTVFIGMGDSAGITTLPTILEAEDATGGTVLSLAGMSGGEYTQHAAIGATEETLLTWALTADQLEAWAGEHYRIIAKLPSMDSANQFKLKIKLAGLTVLWESPWVWGDIPTTDSLLELASLRLPPYLLGTGDLYPLTLELSARDTTGAGLVEADFLHITPLSGWRKLEPKGYGLAYGTSLVDDAIDRKLYVEWGASGRVGHYIGYGEPLRLTPGRDAKLYFLWDNTSGAHTNDRTATVKLYTRPVRRTI